MFRGINRLYIHLEISFICRFYDSAVRALSDIDTTGKDNMAAAFRYIREGFFIPRPLPWRTDEVLEDFHCIIGLVLASTRDVLLCIRELGREAISQETSETELVDVGCRQMDNGELKRDKVTFKEYMSAEPVVEDQTLSEGFHAMWFRGDKRAGLRDLFIHPAGRASNYNFIPNALKYVFALNVTYNLQYVGFA